MIQFIKALFDYHRKEIKKPKPQDLLEYEQSRANLKNKINDARQCLDSFGRMVDEMQHPYYERKPWR